MTFKPAIWRPVAAVLSVANLVAVGFAAGAAEPWHATIHAGLALAFGAWAQRLGRSPSQPAQIEPTNRLEELEAVATQWAKEINSKSPTAQRMLKYSFNLIDDGLVGQQLFAGETTRLAYMTDEAVEGRDAFLQKRAPDWSPFPWYY